MKITIKMEEIQNYSVELRKLLALETKNALLMEGLADESETQVLIFLSLNEELPDYTLRSLSKIDNNILQRNVARHKNTGKETLSYLSKSQYNATREAVASNKKTDSETLKYLAHDKCRAVVVCVVNNPSTTKEILEFLADSKDYLVSRRAKERLLFKQYC